MVSWRRSACPSLKETNWKSRKENNGEEDIIITKKKTVNILCMGRNPLFCKPNALPTELFCQSTFSLELSGIFTSFVFQKCFDVYCNWKLSIQIDSSPTEFLQADQVVPLSCPVA